MPTDTKRERQRRYYVEMLRRYNETPPLDAQGNVVYPAFVDELPDRPLPPPARPLAGEGLRPPPSIGVQQTRREEAQERLRQPPPGPTPTPRRMAPLKSWPNALRRLSALLESWVRRPLGRLGRLLVSGLCHPMAVCLGLPVLLRGAQQDSGLAWRRSSPQS